MIPPVLYKYAVPERINSLVEKKIRFTQPSFLNDPFEFRPAVPEDAAHFEEKVAKKRDNEFREKSRLYGVLSLSETNDSIPMWTHYAESHRGFVIGFDTGSTFLKKALDDQKLHPVRYEMDRVSLTRGSPDNPRVKADAIFRTKSTDWEYEKEWRWLECRSPHEYAELRPAPSGELLYLCPFQPESIQEIALGYRANRNLAESIMVLRSTPEYKHLKVFKVALSESCYKLEIESMSCRDVWLAKPGSRNGVLGRLAARLPWPYISFR